MREFLVNDFNQQHLFPDDIPDVEGMFDAQLSLPLPAVPWVRPLSEIVKRDGREERFDKGKLAAAISRAAQSAGLDETSVAEGIASAVAIYLAKHLNGTAPTADQVSDAVERVLIQMAHAEIALAYARYRDRRARIRRLRQGDMRVLLSELEEARHERESATAMDPSLRVRTSQDSMVAWDRSRIIEVLRRETGLDDGSAALIAAEVEQQIHNAGITTLTTPLVRELVGAKLIEHGLIEESELHRRLGVPLYDASRIIRGITPETVGRDPNATDRVLARAVKKEYALAEVFSPQVTQAHLAGGIHLDALDYVDRLHSADHALAYLAAHGIRLSRDECFARPPTHPETLLTHMVKYSDKLETLFSGSVGWYAFNFMAAPFLHHANEEVLRRFSEMIVYECAYRRIGSASTGEAMRLSLYWSAPSDIADVEAVGPTDQYSGHTYRHFETTARKLALSLIDVFADGGVNNADFDAPILDLSLEEAMLQTYEGVHYLHTAAQTALCRPGVRFLLKPVPDPVNGPVWRPRNVIWHRVALNLPRAAINVEDESGFYRELERLCRLAVTAHKEKRDFIELLLDPTGNRPLAALALEQEDRPYITADNSLFTVDVDGLFECAQVMAGVRGASSQQRQHFMESTMKHLAEVLPAIASSEGLHCILAANDNPGVSRRFATLDARMYPNLAAQIVKTDSHTQALTYTSGISLPEAQTRSPFETARIEGSLHRRLGGQHFTRMALPLHNTSGNALADLLKKIMGQTTCRGITLAADQSG